MSDLVEQGGPERSGPPAWVRPVAVLAVLAVLAGLALAAVVVARSDLLSAGGPPARPAPSTSAAEPITGLVVREGDRLVRYAGDRRKPLGALPHGLDVQARFVHAAGLDGTGPLVSAAATVLFRADPYTASTVRGIGRAERVIAPSAVPGDVYVLQPFGNSDDLARVVEVDTGTGRVVDASPFPGFTGRDGWQPVDTVRAVDDTALVLRRPDGAGVALALALSRAAVRAGRPAFVPLGTVGDLVGVAPDRLLTGDVQRTSCRSDVCRLTVVTFTEDKVVRRAVEPPPGWVFGYAMAASGDSEPLVLVTQAAEPSQRALARVVAGSRRALIVPGSAGVVPWLGMLPAAGGSVVLALADPAAGAHVVVWRPGRPTDVERLDLPTLRPGSTMVCVCR